MFVYGSVCRVYAMVCECQCGDTSVGVYAFCSEFGEHFVVRSAVLLKLFPNLSVWLYVRNCIGNFWR